MPDECFMGTIDPNISYIDDMGNIYSSNVWDKSVNSNVQLDDYGLCSVDDGKTKYDKETDILENVLFDTPLTTGDDLRFKMSKIDGNFYTSPKVDYSVSIKEENDKKFISASGGGFSGCPKYYIPKSVGEYNTLPTRVEQYQTFEFVIRPTQEIKDNTLSYYNPDNFGFFFFYGQRENKWLYYYQEQSNDKTAFEKMLTSQGIIMDTPNMVEIETNNKYLWTNRSCCGWTIFDKDYPHEIVMQYQKKNPNLNYYLLFNRSVDKLNHYKGLTVTTVNPLSMLNCCSHTTGYYDELRKQYPCDSYLQYNLIEKHLQNFPDDLKGLEIYNTNYDYVQDISNKAFGFRITPSGAISYRTISKNCGEDKDLNPVIVAEEYSNDNIIKFGEWNYIVIKIIYDTYIENPECSTYPARNGIIYVYVNGYLKWASKKWKEPVLKELNEHWSKQLGTLNMNLMIGSQGLMETILSNNDQDYPRIVLPTEKYFAGNLVGDLLFFRMGTCNITYKQIQELTTYRKIELGKPELNPPPECVFPKIVETIVFTEYVCQMTSKIVRANITTGGFYSAAMGQDNKLYFCGLTNNGIMFLDDDGEIKPTNITTGNFYSAAIVQNNKVYFCSSDNGIMFLDDDGEIKPTNITTGDFHSVAMGQDNKLYFCSGDNGIMFLDDDGEIKPTNITTNRFYSAAMGQDNKLYFCSSNSDNGVFRLDSTMSGKAFATSATYKRHENDKLTNESMKSLLTDVLPEMTKLKYQLLSESVVEERAKAVVSLFDLETSPKYMSMTIINDKRCLI
jgi:hypothetical protein